MEHETHTKWQPVPSVLRRVAGVLVEKAKTTPDIYPMTINAIATACNQKSNRAPLMQLSNDEVDDALEELRSIGAVVEIQGDGRKPKYKHRLYDWLGVDKTEMAIMAELLLRGQQTLGELRARASRMEKIESLEQLKPMVQGLVEKGLMVELTPPGRGQLVSHNLYLPDELRKITTSIESAGSDTSPDFASSANPDSAQPPSSQVERIDLDNLIQRLSDLESKVAALEHRLDGNETG